MEHELAVYSGIDARGNFAAEITVTDADGVHVTLLVTGNVNAATGDINWSVVAKDNEGASSFEANSIKVKFRLYGIGNNNQLFNVAPDSGCC